MEARDAGLNDPVRGATGEAPAARWGDSADTAAPQWPPPSADDGPTHGREDRPFWRRAAGALIALTLVLAKFGKGLLLLIPKAKFLTTSASMLVSVAAYALLWGWKFAIGFVLLLLVHELGHVFQLRREGIPATAPLFIPFLGAAVGMKRLPDDAGAEARVGLAGPILGSLGCLVPVAIWQATGEEFWQALAFVGFFLNLINLMPVLPLDGGRAMAALSTWMWVIGFGIFLGVAIAFPNPIILLIVLLGGLETYRRFKARKSPESQRYHTVSSRTRVAVAVTYIGLAVLLAVAMQATHLELTLNDV